MPCEEVELCFIVLFPVITDSPYVVLALLMGGYLLCLFYTAAFKRLFQHKACNLQSVLVWRFCTFISCIFACIAVVVAFVLNDNQSIIPLLIFLIGTFLTFFISVIAAFKLSQTTSLERDRNDFKAEMVILEARMVNSKWMHERWKKEEKTWHRLVSSVHEAHKEDKVYENETILTSAVATAPIQPPPYQANNGDVDSDSSDKLVFNDVSASSPSEEFVYVPPPSEEFVDVPPPPSYDENDAPPAINIPPPPPPPPSYDSDDRFTEMSPTSISEAPPNYQSTVSSNFGGVPNYYVPDDVIFLEKNGRNLLLIFEKYIMYTAYKYASLSQRNIWINMVTRCNWTGLLHQLRILNSNLTGAYDKPSQLDVKLANLTHPEYDLPDDSRDLDKPPKAFIKKTKEDIARESNEIRDKALSYFGGQGQYSENWRILMDKLLPTGPVFKSCSTTINSFHLVLRRPATGVISEYEEPGLKIALGASFTIGKRLDVRFKDDECVFEQGSEPVGKKGPVSVAVDKVSFVHKNGELYIMVKGKKVKFTVALASCKTIKWS